MRPGPVVTASGTDAGRTAGLVAIAASLLVGTGGAFVGRSPGDSSDAALAKAAGGSAAPASFGGSRRRTSVSDTPRDVVPLVAATAGVGGGSVTARIGD